ncbi:MAG: sugar ABC transporter substrate-binding protein [Christensenella sp.]|nr:sugar ABC transporter substrate-binding protein [Christensenella sp.]
MEKRTKKLLSTLLVICLAVALVFTGCTPAETPAESQQPSEAPAAATQETEASEKPQEPASSEAAASDDAVAKLVQEASSLSDLEALKFFEGLGDKGLSDAQIIQFFIDLPLSDANKQIHDMYLEEGLDTYAQAYPNGDFYDGFTWETGMGTEITGGFSGNELKLPFSDEYVPLPEGAVGDTNKKYTIGVVSSGLNDAWIANYQDSIQYEAERHDNVEIIFMDYNFDMNTYASQMDTLIAQKVDAIVTWPMIEASSGPPAQRAEEAGIPVITSDRVTSYPDVTCRITGNFPANGAQNGMYLVWKLAQETEGKEVKANVALIRKPAGSTADTIRTGYFLKVCSYFPGINILQSYHDQDNRQESYVNAQNAFQAYDNIDAVFNADCNKAAVSYQACEEAGRLNSREGGKEVIILSIDDSKEVYSLMDQGGIQMNTPYTPLIGDISLRAALKVLMGEDVPQDIATPNIPMVTVDGAEIFGMKTQTPDQWYQYTFGPPYEA